MKYKNIPAKLLGEEEMLHFYNNLRFGPIG